jgi:hypothetical protein
MFLRELSNAEAPEGRAARYDKLCRVYEGYGDGQQNRRIVFVLV